eukprot:TRINITY_DN5342_c0_g1_i1.p1 TRINITY_DN5342_c0_g1~~TRINITY_DN5342_c0_g1_i1.p1  ORF type:complete len:488 (+),score=67.41 TRINITY_DN5342_c0_g1_i1:90-1466(+)
MKIKVLSRNEQSYTRERPTDMQRVHRNAAPQLHPFERAREYKRAVNAVKLDRVFAKPFVGVLEGHSDGVFSFRRHPTRLSMLASGACDGEIRVWNVATKKSIVAYRAHKGFVRGLCFTENGESLYSCGGDRLVHLWKFPDAFASLGGTDTADAASMKNDKPLSTWMGSQAFLSVDQQRKSPIFATTAANFLHLWHTERSEPLKELSWGQDSLTMARFNPTETNIVCTVGEDRGVILYDIRGNTPIRKVVMDMKSNCIAWNPMEPFNFSLANEDHNCYTYDMRKLNVARNVHHDHVGAVLTLDYAPTGREFVSGSYDKTLRIFNTDAGRSRDVYHLKRMQRIFAVQYTGDAKYILSGSDDTNIRLFKARASENLAVMEPRQKEKEDYNQALINRYKEMPEVRRIHKSRNLPSHVKGVERTKRIIKSSQRRKESNVRSHSGPGQVPFKSERKKRIVADKA